MSKDEDDKIVEFPTKNVNGIEVKIMSIDEVMEMVGLQMSASGVAPPLALFPGRNDTAGVAARAALLRFADIIAHEDMHSANGLRKLVLDIENKLGRVTQ